MPATAESDAMLRKWRQEHFPSIPQYQAALERYGISEDELKLYLAWQLAALRFTDQRFHAGSASVDEQMDGWLKQQRASTRIQFKKGAFAQ